MKNEGKNLKNLFTNIKKTDRFFIELTLSLSIIGIIFAFTSSSHESLRLTNNLWTLGIKQFSALIIGICFLFIFWITPYKFWYKITWYFSLLMFALMIITKFIGKSSGGSTRWIDLGFFQFQPSEVAKLAVILLIARLIANLNLFERRTIFYILFILCLIFTILIQPDLGSATILVFLLIQLFFVFGWPLWQLLLGTIIIGCIGYFKILSTSYQRARIEYWLDPYKDPLGKGYNLIQAKYALGLGNLFGVGLGNSIQKQGYLPIPHSDFIFAIIGEEIGLFGATAILILFSAWALRGLFIINKIEDKFGKILGSGIIFIIITQTLVNIAVAVGLLPVTGVTLPFFSCGGTSLIVTLAMCGILFNILSSVEQNNKISELKHEIN